MSDNDCQSGACRRVFVIMFQQAQDGINDYTSIIQKQNIL